MADGLSTDWFDGPDGWADSDRLRERWLLPGVAVLGAMAAGFVVVAAVLLTWEVAIVDSLWTRLLALALMYLLPHIGVGYWVGRRQGLAVEPPIAAGLAPVLLLVVMLFLFGGPALTPVRAPLVTVGAVAVWSGAFAVGMVAGTRLTRGS